MSGNPGRARRCAQILRKPDGSNDPFHQQKKVIVVNRKIMRALGFISRKDNVEWTSASPFLPSFSFYEIHESGAISARPEDIIAAVAALDMRDDRVANLLLSIRELPTKIAGMCRKKPAGDTAVPFGFDTFTLLQRDSHEISMGLAGRFWRPDLSIDTIPSAREFALLDNPGFAKLVLRFQVIEHSRQARTLRTETFVHCGSVRTKMLFTPYWLAIRLASGWIRRRTLASIQKQLAIRVG